MTTTARTAAAVTVVLLTCTSTAAALAAVEPRPDYCTTGQLPHSAAAAAEMIRACSVAEQRLSFCTEISQLPYTADAAEAWLGSCSNPVQARRTADSTEAGWRSREAAAADRSGSADSAERKLAAR